MFKGYKRPKWKWRKLFKGSADIHLEEKEDATILRYSVNAQIGGKLAQLGSRLIDSTSKKLAENFLLILYKLLILKLC